MQLGILIILQLHGSARYVQDKLMLGREIPHAMAWCVGLAAEAGGISHNVRPAPVTVTRGGNKTKLAHVSGF